ncbi:trypco2 family protein [Streptomyces sp. NPDC029004]|uniref:trypco2 family protein n=1 Tax=Streptomyces sp. NPDC029004 TaxID=3154490 RepID=UPI0033E155EE
MSELSPRIDLTQAVQAVRDQLMAATELGRHEPLRFEVGEIHMEFTVELRYDAHVQGGVKAWVFSAEADAGGEKAHTHKVSFTLKPKDAGSGDGWEVGNDNEGDASAFDRLNEH